MANKDGWWQLIISNDDVELDEVDLEHIAELIADGFTQGEINKTWDEEEEN